MNTNVRLVQPRPKKPNQYCPLPPAPQDRLRIQCLIEVFFPYFHRIIAQNDILGIHYAASTKLNKRHEKHWNDGGFVAFEFQWILAQHFYLCVLREDK